MYYSTISPLRLEKKNAKPIAHFFRDLYHIICILHYQNYKYETIFTFT